MKSINEYKELMNKCVENTGDPEAAHGYADDILCEILTSVGYQEIVDLYHEVGKWYA